MSTDRIELSILAQDDINIIKIQGTKKIELQNSSNLKERLFDLVDRIQDNPKIILDLINIDFIDSAGLGVLLTVYKKIKNEQNGKLAIINLQKHPKKLFLMTNMNRLFPIYDTLEEAKKEF